MEGGVGDREVELKKDRAGARWIERSREEVGGGKVGGGGGLDKK